MSDRDPTTHGKIVSTPGVLGGSPRVAGTRISVECITTVFARGCSCTEILEQYPTLVQGDIDAALRFTLEQRRRLELADAVERVREALDDIEDLVPILDAPGEVACWHCLDVLDGPPPKPRCERCPDECDDANCEAPGCEARVREEDSE